MKYNISQLPLLQFPTGTEKIMIIFLILSIFTEAHIVPVEEQNILAHSEHLSLPLLLWFLLEIGAMEADLCCISYPYN
jgi:hypothetical protein